MKNILISALVIAGLVTTTLAATLTPATAQSDGQAPDPGLQISCGQAKDPSSNSTLPATVAIVPGKAEPVELIIWKSEAIKNFSPQRRCEVVSPKLQAAIQAGRYNIVAGGDPTTGVGIVCAVASKEETCDRSKMLFTLKSYASADAVPEQLAKTLNSSVNSPIYQSSGGKYVANLRDLLRRK
ncbi:MAG: COP23 domain-containing protein [Chamaesiphon sp.]|nr:COP23 domain-containing protein [Chamaesiphon sp.]